MDNVKYTQYTEVTEPLMSPARQFNDENNSSANGLIKKSLLSLNDLNEKYVNTIWFTSIALFLCYMFVCITVCCHWFGFSIIDSAYFVVITAATGQQWLFFRLYNLFD